MSMMGFTTVGHRAIEGAEGSEQRGGTMALIDMRYGRCLALFHWQSRLRG